MKAEMLSPLKWPDGQEHTLIDRRREKKAWKKTFLQQKDRLLKQLEKLGVGEALISFNPSPADRLDPGVAVYFSRPLKEDYSWQSALGIDIPNPSAEQIEKAFKAKARIYHPDGSAPDPSLYNILDQHKKRALAWVNGEQSSHHDYCIACDRCTEPRWNLFAILKIIGAVSVMEEYGNPGTLERTFRGFKLSLPMNASESATKVGD
jgi:hypothetical protein